MLGSKKSYVTADHTRAHSKDSLPHNAARCTRPYPKPLITRKKPPTQMYYLLTDFGETGLF